MVMALHPQRAAPHWRVGSRPAIDLDWRPSPRPAARQDAFDGRLKAALRLVRFLVPMLPLEFASRPTAQAAAERANQSCATKSAPCAILRRRELYRDAAPSVIRPSQASPRFDAEMRDAPNSADERRRGRPVRRWSTGRSWHRIRECDAPCAAVLGASYACDRKLRLVMIAPVLDESSSTVT